MQTNDMLAMVTMFGAVHYYNSCRERSTVTRQSILPPSMTAWAFLYENGDDTSFLTLTGLSRAAFEMAMTATFGDEPPPPKKGRKSLLSNSGKLGLFLFYMSSCMNYNHLALLFGVCPTSVGNYLEDMMERVITGLQNHRFAKVKFPKVAQMAHWAEMISIREPDVNNVIGFVDGVALAVQCSEDEEEQSKDYNGYRHDTVCNNVLAFGPDGKIFFAAINYPGSWHDSTVSAGLARWAIEKMDGFKLCVDQGFPRSGALKGKFVGPLTQSQRNRLPAAERDEKILESARYVSLRQASEWGMRALQGSFTRLKSRLPSDKLKRGRIITAAILLHNLRTELCGLNQIKTVFDPEYEQFVNVNGYEKIARYFKN